MQRTLRLKTLKHSWKLGSIVIFGEKSWSSKANQIFDISRPKVMTKCRVFFSSLHAKKKTLGTQRLNMGLLGESLSLKPLRNGNLPQYLGSKISWKKGITYSAFYQNVSIGKKKTRKIFQGKKVETIISFVSFRWWMEVTENVYLCKGHIGYRPYIHVYVEYLKFLSLIPFKKSWTNK